jgi:hypothetical protein
VVKRSPRRSADAPPRAEPRRRDTFLLAPGQLWSAGNEAITNHDTDTTNDELTLVDLSSTDVSA